MISIKNDKYSYYKICGQDFWTLISGNENFYIDIIEPLGHKAKDKNEEFLASYAQMINRFTLEFANDFCIDGKINWEAIVKLNSSTEQNNRKKAKNS